MAKLRLRGNRLLIKRIENISKETEEKIGGRIESVLNKIRNEAVSRVPVDTGFLKNSISVEIDEKKLGGKVEVNAEYAPYVEFGTGTAVSVPSQLSEYAMQFKGKGIKEVNLPARPFLYPAYYKERFEFVKGVKNDLNKIVK